MYLSGRGNRMEEERNGDNNKKSKETEGVLDNGKQSWQWSLVREVRLPESNQAEKPAGNCPRRVSQLSSSFLFFFFFFFFFFQARSLFSRPQGHEPPCSAIKATPPSNETKILSRTEIDSARRRKKKLKNQPSMEKPMIHGLNRRVRIWAAILHINPILFHVEDESTLL